MRGSQHIWPSRNTIRVLAHGREEQTQFMVGNDYRVPVTVQVSGISGIDSSGDGSSFVQVRNGRGSLLTLKSDNEFELPPVPREAILLRDDSLKIKWDSQGHVVVTDADEEAAFHFWDIRFNHKTKKEFDVFQKDGQWFIRASEKGSVAEKIQKNDIKLQFHAKNLKNENELKSKRPISITYKDFEAWDFHCDSEHLVKDFKQDHVFFEKFKETYSDGKEVDLLDVVTQTWFQEPNFPSSEDFPFNIKIFGKTMTFGDRKTLSFIPLNDQDFEKAHNLLRGSLHTLQIHYKPGSVPEPLNQDIKLTWQNPNKKSKNEELSTIINTKALLPAFFPQIDIPKSPKEWPKAKVGEGRELKIKIPIFNAADEQQTVHVYVTTIDAKIPDNWEASECESDTKTIGGRISEPTVLRPGKPTSFVQGEESVDAEQPQTSSKKESFKQNRSLSVNTKDLPEDPVNKLDTARPIQQMAGNFFAVDRVMQMAPGEVSTVTITQKKRGRFKFKLVMAIKQPQVLATGELGNAGRKGPRKTWTKEVEVDFEKTEQSDEWVITKCAVPGFNDKPLNMSFEQWLKASDDERKRKKQEWDSDVRPSLIIQTNERSLVSEILKHTEASIIGDSAQEDVPKKKPIKVNKFEYPTPPSNTKAQDDKTAIPMHTNDGFTQEDASDAGDQSTPSVPPAPRGRKLSGNLEEVYVAPPASNTPPPAPKGNKSRSSPISDLLDDDDNTEDESKKSPSAEMNPVVDPQPKGHKKEDDDDQGKGDRSSRNPSDKSTGSSLPETTPQRQNSGDSDHAQKNPKPGKQDGRGSSRPLTPVPNSQEARQEVKGGIKELNTDEFIPEKFEEKDPDQASTHEDFPQRTEADSLRIPHPETQPDPMSPKLHRPKSGQRNNSPNIPHVQFDHLKQAKLQLEEEKLRQDNEAQLRKQAEAEQARKSEEARKKVATTYVSDICNTARENVQAQKEEIAATKIQSVSRQKAAREEVKNNRQEKNRQEQKAREEMAVRLQSRYRSHVAQQQRSVLQSEREAKQLQEQLQEQKERVAAVRLQSEYRSHAARKQRRVLQDEKDRKEKEVALMKLQKQKEETDAAIRLQSVQRSRTARNESKKLKSQQEQENQKRQEEAAALSGQGFVNEPVQHPHASMESRTVGGGMLERQSSMHGVGAPLPWPPSMKSANGYNGPPPPALNIEAINNTQGLDSMDSPAPNFAALFNNGVDLRVQKRPSSELYLEQTEEATPHGVSDSMLPNNFDGEQSAGQAPRESKNSQNLPDQPTPNSARGEIMQGQDTMDSPQSDFSDLFNNNVNLKLRKTSSGRDLLDIVNRIGSNIEESRVAASPQHAEQHSDLPDNSGEPNDGGAQSDGSDSKDLPEEPTSRGARGETMEDDPYAAKFRHRGSEPPPYIPRMYDDSNDQEESSSNVPTHQKKFLHKKSMSTSSIPSPSNQDDGLAPIPFQQSRSMEHLRPRRPSSPRVGTPAGGYSRSASPAASPRNGGNRSPSLSLFDKLPTLRRASSESSRAHLKSTSMNRDLKPIHQSSSFEELSSYNGNRTPPVASVN